MEINEEILDKKLNQMVESIKFSVDEKIRAYNAGFKSSNTHNQPSPETMEFIRNTEKTMTTYAEDIATIKEKLMEVPTKEGMELAMTTAVSKVLDCCEAKYARSSRVSTLEKIVYGAVGLILTAFMSSIIYMVIKING